MACGGGGLNNSWGARGGGIVFLMDCTCLCLSIRDVDCWLGGIAGVFGGIDRMRSKIRKIIKMIHKGTVLFCVHFAAV